MDKHRIIRMMGTIGALLTWMAVILQFTLILHNRTHPIAETIVQFFSYYTILTNLLVACCFTALALTRPPNKRNFFTNPSVLAATAAYIIVVSVIYNVILRGLWAPQGLQRFIDELLHTVIPLLYVVYWLTVVQKVGIRWKNIFLWLLYPLAYFSFILIRGALSGFYPYPFIHVTDLGWNQVLINSVCITGGFVVLFLLIIALSKRISQKEKFGTAMK